MRIIAAIALTITANFAFADCAARRAPVAGHYAPVNGVQMYYEIHGVSDGKTPPLVLIHGGGSSIDTSFGTFLGPLSQHRQVIAFDQRGHGRTADIIDHPFSFDESGEDAVALLQFLKIDRADFLGYSNGGNIAQLIAIKHPKVVRKLILQSTFFKRDAFAPEFWEGMRHASLATMPAELKEAYTKVAPHPEQLQMLHDKSVKRMLEYKDMPVESIHAISAPTLILNADGDVIRPEHAVEMWRTIPHAELAIIPGSDHMKMTTCNDTQLSIIDNFLRR